jgi:adenylylsulfate kinase
MKHERNSRPASQHIKRAPGHISSARRANLLGQHPRTIWFTGLPASGKTTLAYALERHLVASGRACYVLDGDNLRHGLNRDLGFSDADRTENIRRVAEVAALMNDAGLIVISALISPRQADRVMASEIIGKDRFIEVYLSTPADACELRDPKGLYAKARSGEIASFTGVSAPYEAPAAPALMFDTAQIDVAACVAQIISHALAGSSKHRADGEHGRRGRLNVPV